MSNLDHMHLADTPTCIRESFGCCHVWLDLELLLHLRLLLDLWLLHLRLMLHRRMLHLWLHVLLHLRSWMWRRGRQHRVVILCVTPAV